MWVIKLQCVLFYNEFFIIKEHVNKSLIAKLNVSDLGESFQCVKNAILF